MVKRRGRRGKGTGEQACLVALGAIDVLGVSSRTEDYQKFPQLVSLVQAMHDRQVRNILKTG
jgi:hypothetical protein